MMLNLYYAKLTKGPDGYTVEFPEFDKTAGVIKNCLSHNSFVLLTQPS